MEDEIRAHIDGKRYRKAFELMMAQYQNKVFRLACSMLGDQALAEETVQDIFVRVWRLRFRSIADWPPFRLGSTVSLATPASPH
jgi:DNA-directed RNA polymerase specialized sigma24 family protein